MFGIPDPWVLLAFLLSLGSSVLCIAWGLSRWHEADREDEPVEELRDWAVEESKVKEEI